MTTDLKRAGRVRDPVHGYVVFTGIERVLLEHPIAQRMRYIGQSGMAQTVFPEVRSSRFAHSLGAMHLASRFLAASLRNAEDDTSAAIGVAMKEAIDEIAPYGPGLPRDGVRELFQGQGLLAAGSVDDDHRDAALLFEQGLRLAALFHDLGHLPFSHDFERALEELLRREDPGEFRALAEQGAQLAVHERIGYRLVHHLQRQLFTEFAEERESQAVVIAFSIAEKILEAPVPPVAEAVPDSAVDGLYMWLHKLIAGELDVDRCDYVLRDTRPLRV